MSDVDRLWTRCRRAVRNGTNGMSPALTSMHAPYSVVARSSRARDRNSRSSRDLPEPASPRTRTMPGRPALARDSAPRS